MSSSNFVDYVNVCCRSGKGGAGSTHFHRDRTTAMGGPDGGDGGKGGDIIVRGNSQLWTLLHLKYNRHITAKPGGSGGKSLKHGANGDNAFIEVPLGTIARDAETGEIELEITENGEEILLLAGGRGGLGNDHFKSPTNRAPRYAQPGEAGQESWKILELKILADVGLVGFPNAGKSTLLASISAAKPEIANYPFTTLEPNLGIVSYHDNQSFVMADIPGIIEGAHTGKGLGIRFLRHIERNSVLLFMVPADSDDINKEYDVLVNELAQYNPELLDKNRILAISKSDLLDEELKEEISKDLPDIPTIFISSITNSGLNSLKNTLWENLK